MNKREFLRGAALAGALAPVLAQTVQAQNLPASPPAVANGPIPKDWIDPDTGHRVVRISSTDNSQSLYFNFPACSPDGQWMVYNSARGICLSNLTTFEEKLLNSDGYNAFSVSQKQPLVYASKRSAKSGFTDYVTIHMLTGKVTLVASIDKGGITSVNADDTLLVGSYALRDVPLQPGPKVPGTDGGYNAIGADGKPMTFAAAKEFRMSQRLHADVPMEIFTINIKTGERKVIVASTDWLNHMQFSPTDPNLLMYCHEGPWHEVERIWTINIDGTNKRPLHKRTMNMEIAGHEFFNWDGTKIFYDLQTPRGEDFWLADYDLKTGARRWFHMLRNEWSVHFNVNKDGTLFAGDGGDSEMVARAPDGKWLYLFRPEIIEDIGPSAPNAADLVRPGVLRSEKLVNMAKHDYRLEPNLRFSPDGKWLIFRSNMHGPVHVYAVAVDKT